MKYEQKIVHFALAQISRKMGVRNHIQRHKCNHCNKTFTFQKKLNLANIWFDSSQRKQTYKELAEKYKCSVRTVQRYIDKAPKIPLNKPISPKLKILMDTTFFEREFCIVVMMDSLSEKVIVHQIVKTERDGFYKSIE